jgi:hypothetical protein
MNDFAVVVIALLWTAMASADSPITTGGYAAVTESEWSMDLELCPNGTSKLEVATWEPGEGDNAKVDSYHGTWRTEGTNVIVSFEEGQAIFAFYPNLSFEEFGREGAAPGLVGTSASFEPTLFVKRQLWLKSELKKVFW